ncbi:MAG: hypothetical protein JWN43_701 [Gammaproteobacteria bacterium]|nr:hypothetical protein [Gammaproteobacteria bacterium]
MDAPHSMEVPSTQPLFGRAVRALGELEGSSKLAIACIVFGWFFMTTLVVSLGSLRHGVRFFDMSAVIFDQSRLFFDVDTPFHRMFFASLCLLCLLAPLVPHMVKSKFAWAGYLAPLALILVCAVVLYSRTSGEYFAVPADTRSLSASFIRFASDWVHRGSDLVWRHVAIGGGAYLALIGSLILAVQGIRRFRYSRS